jgi:ribosome-associated protein
VETESRTRLKRKMHDLQELGERLVSLSPGQIRAMEMPEDLTEAVLLARTLKSRGARRRQIQYIGVLMRETDPEPIRRALEALSLGLKTQIRTFRMVERWRDDLVSGDDAPLAEILHRFPDADQSLLLRMVRDVREEQAPKGVSRSSRRALFRYLRDLADASPTVE